MLAARFVGIQGASSPPRVSFSSLCRLYPSSSRINKHDFKILDMNSPSFLKFFLLSPLVCFYEREKRVQKYTN